MTLLILLKPKISPKNKQISALIKSRLLMHKIWTKLYKFKSYTRQLSMQNLIK